MKAKLNEDPHVMQLWHGTRFKDPLEIISSESGLNINFARGGQQLGKGLYFAADVFYSCPTFCYAVPGKSHTYKVLLCDVLVGESMVVSEFDSTSHI